MESIRIKTGILGGTFNPIHTGHLILAQDALEQYELDEVLLIPAHLPPHKNGDEVIEARHRLAMVETVTDLDPHLSCSAMEIERKGMSYSIDTIRQLLSERPRSEYHFIIGSDTLPELHTWKDIYELLELCAFNIFARPGFDPDGMTAETLQLRPPWPDCLREHIVHGHQVEISSTDIRMRVAEGMRIRYLVPESVEMYIYEHRLYNS
jgi:nicotinate-nucleotide adenylyltransferase